MNRTTRDALVVLATLATVAGVLVFLLGALFTALALGPNDDQEVTYSTGAGLAMIAVALALTAAGVIGLRSVRRR